MFFWDIIAVTPFIIEITSTDRTLKWINMLIFIKVDSIYTLIGKISDMVIAKKKYYNLM